MKQNALTKKKVNGQCKAVIKSNRDFINILNEFKNGGKFSTHEESQVDQLINHLDNLTVFFVQLQK